MKLDPYKHEEKYLRWKDKVNGEIPEITKENSELILKYLSDMERGLNVATDSVKGSRSFNRLNNLRDKLCFFSKKFKEIFNLDLITSVTEEQLVTFFSDMRNGTIKKTNGKNYQFVISSNVSVTK